MFYSESASQSEAKSQSVSAFELQSVSPFESVLVPVSDANSHCVSAFAPVSVSVSVGLRSCIPMLFTCQALWLIGC